MKKRGTIATIRVEPDGEGASERARNGHKCSRKKPLGGVKNGRNLLSRDKKLPVEGGGGRVRKRTDSGVPGVEPGDLFCQKRRPIPSLNFHE